MSLSTGLFDDISPAVTAELNATRRQASFAMGETLFMMGERPDRLHCVCAGRIKVWRPSSSGDALTLYYLGKGSAPGLATIARGTSLPVSMTATTAVETFYWPAAQVLRWLHEDARFATNGLRLLSEALDRVVDRLEDVTTVRADQQIGRALLRLAGERSEWNNQGEATVEVSRQDLADLTGTTLFTASRTLSDWGRQGLVESSRGRIVIKDAHALATLSEVDG